MAKGIDFDIAEYAASRPRCEVWKLCSNPVRSSIAKGTAINPWAWWLHAEQMAHVIGGSGRKHYRANMVHANRAVHAWCDSHGNVGRVLLMAAKFERREHDFALWSRLAFWCNDVLGWLDTDEVREDCERWGIETLRARMVSSGNSEQEVA